MKRPIVVLIALSLTIATLTACSDSKNASSQLPPTTSSPAPAQVNPEPIAVAEPDGKRAYPEPVVVSGAPASKVLGIDPCTLLDTAAFAKWAGATVGNPIPLEHGTACGLAAEGDKARVALSLVPSSGTGTFLTQEQFDRRVVLSEVPGGKWVAQAPVVGSDLLVALVDNTAELVVELSTQNNNDEASRKSISVTVANTALSKLAVG